MAKWSDENEGGNRWQIFTPEIPILQPGGCAEGRATPKPSSATLARYCVRKSMSEAILLRGGEPGEVIMLQSLPLLEEKIECPICYSMLQ